MLGFKDLLPPAGFCSVCRTFSALPFFRAEVKSLACPSESCDCIEMASSGHRVRDEPLFLRGFCLWQRGSNRSKVKQTATRARSVELDRGVWATGWLGCAAHRTSRFPSTSSALLFDRNVFTAAAGSCCFTKASLPPPSLPLARSLALHCVVVWGDGQRGPASSSRSLLFFLISDLISELSVLG